MSYCIYLRKSRADREAEEHGEGETLARHEKTLLELAKKQKLNIRKVYKEVVSGETIASRPVVQQLLQDVEQGIWYGVLVMEVERLARGDTIDQGIMSQTFKYSNTLIVTPSKTYNPNNEFDEEYFEFGLFMSRREYKTINRRLQRGRLTSVQEGKYVGSIAPYGYKRVKLTNDKGYTLTPIENEANVVRMIFELYSKGELLEDGSYNRLGVALIVRRLNELKIPAKKGGPWVTSSVRDILINPVYMGKIRWNWRPVDKKMVDGKLTKARKRSNDYILIDGLHPAIIDDITFNNVQKLMSKNPPRPIGKRNTVKNPLAGLFICGKCGRKMIRRPYANCNQADTLMCPVTCCDNVSAPLYMAEDSILSSLAAWLENYNLKWANKPQNSSTNEKNIKEIALNNYKSELKQLQTQLNSAYDLIENGIYSTEVFSERSKTLGNKISDVKSNINILSNELKNTYTPYVLGEALMPKVEKLLDVYNTLDTPQAKNDMLKEVIDKVVYTKKVNGRWHNSPDNFSLQLFPKLPQKND